MKLYDRALSDQMIQSLRQTGEMMERMPEDRLNDLWRNAQPSRVGHNNGPTWEMLRAAEAAYALEHVVVFDASNVAAYVETHGFDASSIPCWIPPYDHMWWETSKTSYIDPNGVKPSSIGALSQTRRYKQRVGPGDDDYEWNYDVQWTVFFVEPPKAHVNILRREYADDLPMVLGANGLPLADFDETYRHSSPMWGMISPFLMAIGFTHCKNVEIVAGSQPEGALRKKQERKLGRPLTEFKELVIDPHMTQKRVEGGTRRLSQGHTKALHIARGHFAHYTEDKPLFGKYTGTFWRPAHVRGSAEVGTVYKDYKVKP